MELYSSYNGDDDTQCEHEPVMSQDGFYVCAKCGLVLGETYEAFKLPMYKRRENIHFTITTVNNNEILFTRNYMKRELAKYSYQHCADKYNGDVKEVEKCIIYTALNRLSNELGFPLPNTIDVDTLVSYIEKRLRGVKPIGLFHYIERYVFNVKMVIKRVRSMEKYSKKLYVVYANNSNNYRLDSSTPTALRPKRIKDMKKKK